jgi:hypothetical protein
MLCIELLGLLQWLLLATDSDIGGIPCCVLYGKVACGTAFVFAAVCLLATVLSLATTFLFVRHSWAYGAIFCQGCLYCVKQCCRFAQLVVWVEFV